MSKNPFLAMAVLVSATAALAGVMLLSGKDDASSASAIARANDADSSDNDNAGEVTGGNGGAASSGTESSVSPESWATRNVYLPPNPEPDIDREALARQTESLKRAVPKAVTESLVTEQPSVDDPSRLDGMVWIPGGVFVMGNDFGPPDEAPRHAVALDGFWMDSHEVTNRQFQAFVDATGYVTTAEQPPTFRSIRPGSPMQNAAILEEYNQPGSICSLQINSEADIDPVKGPYSWWDYVVGADWKHPLGPKDSIDDFMDHPVVHVSWLDAKAYCDWAGKSLPTEAQWEYASRGGHEGRVYPWGNTRNPDGTWLHNIWQGNFPLENTLADGFERTSPVGRFPANDFGLFDMSGNVWEWCADYYQPDYYFNSPIKNPPGPKDSFDPQEPDYIKRVQRGGSFMCSEQYCIGYRVASRMKGEEDTGAFHTGFRCVVNVGSDSPDR
ncbi:MAG: formylglycine-generating enzyme family protein [Planctomycetaceae bacterium]